MSKGRVLMTKVVNDSIRRETDPILGQGSDQSDRKGNRYSLLGCALTPPAVGQL
jgi:hypothetical protein